MNRWKLIAIIFIVLFVLETSFVLWGLKINADYERDYYSCMYDICEDYPYADYLEPICSCYDYDIMGELVIAKEDYIK